MLCTRAVLVAWCTISIYAIVTAALVLEHDLGDGTWTTAGTIDTDAEEWVLERTALSAADTTRLEQLIASDGLYRLRTASARPVATAVPARCLAGAHDALTLFVAADGTPQAINYHGAGAPCPPSAAALPATTPVHPGRPLVIPNPTLMPRAQPKGAAPPKPAAPGAKGEAQDAGAPAAAHAEEKTWLQKNWIFLIPVFFVVMNLLGGGAPQAGG